MSKRRVKSRDASVRLMPRLRPVAEAGHQRSATAVAAEALQTGVLPQPGRRRDFVPRESETMLLGDPDDHVLANTCVGDEMPGGSSPTSDQNGVDDIGRAYGLQEEDSGALRSAAEVLGRRDRHRIELQPPGRPRG